MGTTALAVIIASVFADDAPQGIWAMLHCLQLWLLVPLIAKFIGSKLKNLILASGFAIFNFSFFRIHEWSMFESLVDKMSFEQRNEYLEALGMNTGSVFVNNLGQLFVIFLMFLAYLILRILSHWTKDSESRISKFINKLHHMYTYSVFIRIIIETYVFLLVGSLFEVRYYLFEAHGNPSSIIMAILILFKCISELGLAYRSWNKHKIDIHVDTS